MSEGDDPKLRGRVIFWTHVMITGLLVLALCFEHKGTRTRRVEDKVEVEIKLNE